MRSFFQTIIAAFLGLALFFIVQTSASAHVAVKPVQSQAGAYETYTVQVPTEKNVPTIKVALRVPGQVEFVDYQAVPGWSVTTAKGADGNIQTVTWSAKGQGIAPGQFQQFQFTALNPKKNTQLAWNAYQYYQDGSIVEWTQKAGAETPHAITQIVSGPADGASAGQPAGRSAFVLSIIALLLSVISAVLAVVTLVIIAKKRGSGAK
ncbi:MULTISPECIES: YcnI family copper-binding membrane protein [unclassified Sporolactobacillus]|uniref:YcnI family copper-binding membrane protein n=1 Tax=unclassified Sporolactobacillus TaxID=2628533 RepID=UPI0023678D88|nr:YcnI family protein [Sporolactobacillus sp. CQH2019]MDD9147417.1 YcnI family protein [Sporolactobacillus sp. CQH2019]